MALSLPALSITLIVIAQARAPAHHPDTLRDSISRALADAVAAASPRDQAGSISAARRLADQYSADWSDPFHARLVDRFSRASANVQRAVVSSDSARRSGIAALPSLGASRALTILRDAMRFAMQSNEPAALVPVHVAIGGAFYRLGELDSADAYLRRAIALGNRIADKRSVANALGVLASVAGDRGDAEKALGLYRRASALRTQSGDTRGKAADANNIGAILQERGDLNGATDSYQLALDLNRHDGRKGLVALNLGNLAGIAAARGEYGKAESLYSQALAINSALGLRAEQGFLHHSLGRVYSARGEYDKAVRSLEEAARIHDASGARTDAIEARVDLAAVRTAMGSPDIAREILATAAGNAEAVNVPDDVRAHVAMAQGDLSVEFGTFANARLEYERAATLYRTAGDSSGLADALVGSALVRHARGDYASASSILRRVAAIRVADDPRVSGRADLLLAEMQITRGDLESARRTAARARESFQRVRDAAGEAAALAISGDVLRQKGLLDSSVDAYMRGLRRLGSRRASVIKWRLHAGAGQALFRKGSLNLAAVELRHAISISEAMATGVRLEERRAGLNSDKWIAYRELALVELARRRVGEAFALSERLRARQMVELVARGRLPAPAGSSSEQDMRRRITALTRELESDVSSFQNVRERRIKARPLNTVRADLEKAQRDYAAELARLREKDPSYARLVSGTTRSWKEIASRLKPDQALIEYMLDDSVSTAFVVTRDTVVAVKLDVGQAAISNLVDFARRTIDRAPRNGKPRLWSVPLQRLYATLIRPLESRGLLAGKKSLLIVPHGELHLLSFASLIHPGTNRFLVEYFDIAYAPSGTVWTQLMDRPARALPAGVLALAPNVRRLPATRQEVKAIGKIYGNRATVKTGNDATSQVLQAGIPGAGIIHLATFGVLNKHNPLFSFVELAPGGSADGQLDVTEVFGLRLSGQLVVLSACQTALGSGALADVPPGDDWVSLVQGFLQAGASSVVASLWPVDDRATAELMTSFHRRKAAGASSASAIAMAQRLAIRNARTADPFYWAAFSSSGRTE